MLTKVGDRSRALVQRVLQPQNNHKNPILSAINPSTSEVSLASVTAQAES